jgi:heme/copper-type cytochrome/quinol oxidase subunit 3
VLFADLVPDPRPLPAACSGWRSGLELAAFLGRSFSASRGWNGFDSCDMPDARRQHLRWHLHLLIGCHAAHVFVALVWLVTLAVLARRAHPGWSSSAGLEMCTAYWYFVCGLWAFLFVLVYLN